MSREDGHSAASSISFGFGASNDMVRVISHRLSTDRGDIEVVFSVSIDWVVSIKVLVVIVVLTSNGLKTAVFIRQH